MTTLVLQGHALTRDAALSVAGKVQGTIEQRGDYLRIGTRQKVSSETLHALRAQAAFDLNLLPEDFNPEDVRLLVTDMDSTLINIECIDEIADFIGKKPEVAAITESAMRGEIDFETSLTRRVALLAGLDTSALEHVYNERLRLNPGADRMIEGLKKAGIKIALVSGGFTFFTERLKKRLALDYAHSNVLEIDGNRLTGRVLGKITGAEGKRDFLLRLCAELGISTAQTVAVGDGANDLLMMEAAGLSIAYHAKPKVQAQASVALNHCGLEGILGLLDISQRSD